MVDEKSPAAPLEAAPAQAQKKKAVAKAMAASAKSSMLAAGTNAAAMIAVYVILGILVLGTTFYAGYLMGKSSGSGSTTKTGSATNGKLQVIEYSDYQCPFCG